MSKEKDLNQKLEEIYGDLKTAGVNAYDKFSKMKIKFGVDIDLVNKSNNPTPEYATEGASGFDLRANLEDEPITLKPFERRLIPTGLYFGLPLFYELQVRPRSGLALKHGITVLNTPGTVDADYRGEVGVILINLGDKEFTIEHGDRIAQAVIAKSEGKTYYNLNVKDSLDETERNADGFGSTGVK